MLLVSEKGGIYLALVIKAIQVKIWLECCWLLVLCNVGDPVVSSLGVMCTLKYQQDGPRDG